MKPNAGIRALRWTAGAVACLSLLPPLHSDDSQPCGDCHEETRLELAATPHGDPAVMAPAAETTLCVACHRDVQDHLESGGIEPPLSFGDHALPSEQIAVCRNCHGGQHPRFLASEHGRQGLGCTTCHRIHEIRAPPRGRFELTVAGTILHNSAVSVECASCHAEIFSEFELNERHRLQEQILECTSCHDPHEPATRVLLGGFKHEICLSCHPDKGGPFVFEHAASRAEGCGACHSPHGSPNRHLLTFENVAHECYSCHLQVPASHGLFDPDVVCTNCHAAIHGSNLDPFFLR